MISEYGSKHAIIIGIAILLPLLTGCIDITGQRRLRHARLVEERDRLLTDLRKFAPLFNEKDRLFQELQLLKSQEEQLLKLQKIYEAQKK